MEPVLDCAEELEKQLQEGVYLHPRHYEELQRKVSLV